MFKAGAEWTGNAKGRPKAGRGLSDQIKKKTKNGQELIQYYYDIFANGELKHELRLEAAKRLEDRGWGKAAQTVEVKGGIEVHDYREQFDKVMADPQMKAAALLIAERIVSEEPPPDGSTIH